MAELLASKVQEIGITMRKPFILVALAFALVTAATATVVATTPYAEATIADAG